MADVSLDELIRRRGFSARGTSKRPMLGRGAAAVGRTFDARNKIGVGDARQRLVGPGQTGGGGGGGGVFQVKDAREKLGQKDARFRIRGRGGSAGAIQDARQMINSRKQQQGPSPLDGSSQTIKPMLVGLQMHVPQIQIHNTAALARQFPAASGLNVRAGIVPQPGGGLKKVVDARDRLSLKRSITGTVNQGLAAPLKITKTIQQRPVGMTSGIRINAPSRTSQSGDSDVIPNKQMKITTGSSFAQTRPGAMSTPFSMSAPITKVVKNDTYTAPPPVPVAPSRSNQAQAAASRSSASSLAPISRTLATGHGQNARPGGDANSQAAPPQPAFSPLEGTKITVNNLHPRVTEEDIVELFCVCGALKRARLVKQGVAEVVFVKKEDAINAYRKYNNRCLDGQPMKCNLHIQGNVITSDQPILLRLSDTPGGGGGGKKDGLPPSLSRPRSSSSQPTAEVDPQTILKALFKSSAQTPPAAEPPSSQATAFHIKI
ncbi:polymerase delta-interacting protein 3 [Denticeps clupeoides]|uniref:RRM domain-containing protein n=1 Tax=Denticeps clupeoides TaxID=299321 RepID=A0AAY4D3D1_9TELE|nr:polymerase delta-interacting protein 3 [Denticeps clupeoides]